MPLAARVEGVSVDDYLAGEQAGEIKHEYIGGVVYAMAGATKAHNQIALNVYTAFRQGLHRGNCRAYVSDVKVRLKIMGDDVFYYPDVMVGCDPRDTHRDFVCFPKVLVEVLSDSTERLDRREKRWSYQTIETLEEYVLVAQDRVEVTLFRRANNWKADVFTKLKQTINMPSLGLSFPMAAIYEGTKVR